MLRRSLAVAVFLAALAAACSGTARPRGDPSRQCGLSGSNVASYLTMPATWYTADALTWSGAPAKGAPLGEIASLGAAKLVGGPDRGLPTDTVAANPAFLKEATAAVASGESLLVGALAGNPALSPTGAAIYQVRVLLGIRADGTIDVRGDCRGVTSMTASLDRGLRASGLLAKYPRPIDAFLAVLADPAAPAARAFLPAAKIDPGPTVADWLARPADKRTILPRLMPPELAKRLFPFTFFLVIPTDWTRNDLGFCFKVPLGWQETCVDADARDQTGSFMWNGNRLPGDDIEVWLTQAGTGSDVLYARLGTIDSAELTSATEASPAGVPLVIIEPRNGRSTDDLAKRPPDAPSMITVIAYNPGATPTTTTASTTGG